MNSRRIKNNWQVDSRIIREILETENHELNLLTKKMHENRRGSIYLIGKQIGNDYCFGSDDLGIILSVLPEDIKKAQLTGIHPMSDEIYFIVSGCVTFEQLINNKVVEKKVEEGDYIIFPKGMCHKVKEFVGQSTSLIIKTNLSKEPEVIRCKECKENPDCKMINR